MPSGCSTLTASSGQKVFLSGHSSMEYTRRVQSSVRLISSNMAMSAGSAPASCMPTRPTLCSSFMADATNIIFRSLLGLGHSDVTKSMALSQNTPIPGVRTISPPGTSSGRSSGSRSSTALDTHVQCTSTRSSMKYLPFSSSSSSSMSYHNVSWSPLPNKPSQKRGELEIKQKKSKAPTATGIPPITI